MDCTDKGKPDIEVTKLRAGKLWYHYPCGCSSQESPKYSGTPNWQNRWLCPKCKKPFSR